jgi:hypothetical protein
MKRSDGPRCSDTLHGYGIGVCAGCNRFPVVIYACTARVNGNVYKWRCETCYAKEHITPPSNRVSL